MKKTIVLSMFPLALALAACGEAKKTEPAMKTVESHSCKAMIAEKVEPKSYEGRAEGPEEAKVAEDAWADVCGKLPEEQKASCKDEGKWEVMISGGSASAGGPTTYTKTIQLREKLTAKEFSAESESETSVDEACAAAVAAACKAAGSEGDCVAKGTHEARGRSSSTTRKKVAEPQ